MTKPTTQPTDSTDSETQPTDGPEILEENDTYWYVKKPDGTTTSITKSPRNRLLYDYNLYGLLRGGNDIVMFNHGDDTDGPPIRLVASDDAREYQLKVGEAQPIHLGEHLKSDLVDALIDVYEGEERDVTPLVEFYDAIRKDRVRNKVVDALASRQPFAEVVTSTEDGWLIHDHLLLTWKRDLHHPNTTAYNRRGNTVAEGASEIAYDVEIREPRNSDTDRELTVDGTTYRLTDAEMEFVALAMWGVKYAPRLKEGDES